MGAKVALWQLRKNANFEQAYWKASWDPAHPDGVIWARGPNVERPETPEESRMEYGQTGGRDALQTDAIRLWLEALDSRQMEAAEAVPVQHD